MAALQFGGGAALPERQVSRHARFYHACICLPLSLSTTKAQLRPAAPCTPPPGCAPAPHRYSPCSGVRCML